MLCITWELIICVFVEGLNRAENKAYAKLKCTTLCIKILVYGAHVDTNTVNVLRLGNNLLDELRDSTLLSICLPCGEDRVIFRI